MSKVEYMCKGCWALGTACGKCTRCILSAPDYIQKLEEKVKNVRYMVIEQVDYEGSSINYFDSRVEADQFLFNRLGQMDNNLLSRHIDAYQLIEYTQDFNVATALDCYRAKREEVIKNALAKLSDEDKVVLGLTKA